MFLLLSNSRSPQAGVTLDLMNKASSYTYLGLQAKQLLQPAPPRRHQRHVAPIDLANVPDTLIPRVAFVLLIFSTIATAVLPVATLAVLDLDCPSYPPWARRSPSTATEPAPRRETGCLARRTPPGAPRKRSAARRCASPRGSIASVAQWPACRPRQRTRATDRRCSAGGVPCRLRRRPS